MLTTHPQVPYHVAQIGRFYILSHASIDRLRLRRLTIFDGTHWRFKRLGFFWIAWRRRG